MIARSKPYTFCDLKRDLIQVLPIVNNLDLGTKLAEGEEWHHWMFPLHP